MGCIHNGAPPLATALPARRGSCFYLVHSSTYQQPSHNYTTTTIHDAHKYVNRMYRIETTDNVHYNMQYLPHVRTVRVRSMRMLEIWKTWNIETCQIGSDGFRSILVKENQIGSDLILDLRSDLIRSTLNIRVQNTKRHLFWSDPIKWVTPD